MQTNIKSDSVGDIYPWRILITGQLDALNYWIVNPQGRKSNTPYDTVGEALLWAAIFADPMLDT